MGIPQYGQNGDGGALSVHKDAGFKLLTTGTYSALESESGIVYGLDGTGGATTITINLPDTTGLTVGVYYTFLVVGTSTGEYTIKCQDLTDTTGDTFIGGVMLGASGATDNEAAAFAQAAADDSQIVLDNNLADSAGGLGSSIKVKYLGMVSNRGHWLVSGNAGTADPNSTGAALFTNGS
tara:strand:+ start:34 stop:573 length:540 start_codon:yes stop_codon:yes gene_type:complete